MTRDEAKAILSIWRPDGSDSADPVFAEALAAARNDPELLAWLHEQQDFDLEMTDSLAAIHGPAEGRREILAQAPVILRQRKIMHRFRWTLAAAVFLVACALGVERLVLIDRVLPQPPYDLAMAAEHLSVNHKAMEVFSRNPDELRHWLAEQDSPYPSVLPGRIPELTAYGAQAWRTNRGGVSLICFYSEQPGRAYGYAQNNEETEWLHFFIFSGELSRIHSPNTSPQLVELREWVFVVWRETDRAYAVGLPAEAGAADRLRALLLES